MTELIAELQQVQARIPRSERLVQWLANIGDRTQPIASETPHRVPPHRVPSPSDLLVGASRAAGRPNNLPRERDSFCGRQEELVALQSLLSDGHRLITVHGPGGAGKTRLTQQLCREAATLARSGCWFVDITDASDLGGIMLQTASVLQVKLTDTDGAEALETLGTAMAGRGPSLFIFDNCEQAVADAAEALSTWLQCAPDALFGDLTRAIEHPGRGRVSIGTASRARWRGLVCRPGKRSRIIMGGQGRESGCHSTTGDPAGWSTARY